jgi:hypothetical protein
MTDEQEEIAIETKRGSSAIFRQCDPDPKGSVSKAWSFSLLFIIFFFGFAIFEGMCF